MRKPVAQVPVAQLTDTKIMDGAQVAAGHRKERAERASEVVFPVIGSDANEKLPVRGGYEDL